MRINRKFFFCLLSLFSIPTRIVFHPLLQKRHGTMTTNDDEMKNCPAIVCLKERGESKRKFLHENPLDFMLAVVCQCRPCLQTGINSLLSFVFSVRLLNALAGLNENETTKTTMTTVEGCRRTKGERERGKIPRSMKSMWRFSHFRCRCRLDSTVVSHRACATGNDWKWWWESRNRVLHARMPLYASESSELRDFFIHSSGSWIKLCFS